MCDSTYYLVKWADKKISRVGWIFIWNSFLKLRSCAPSAALPALAFFLLGGKVKAISQAPLFWSRLSFSIFAQYCNVILSFPFFFTGKGAKKLGKKRCEKTRVEDKLLQELIYLFNVEVCPLCVKRIRAVKPDGSEE